jgi:hypothetical protein
LSRWQSSQTAPKKQLLQVLFQTWPTSCTSRHNHSKYQHLHLRITPTVRLNTLLSTCSMVRMLTPLQSLPLWAGITQRGQSHFSTMSTTAFLPATQQIPTKCLLKDACGEANVPQLPSQLAWLKTVKMQFFQIQRLTYHLSLTKSAPAQRLLSTLSLKTPTPTALLVSKFLSQTVFRMLKEFTQTHFDSAVTQAQRLLTLTEFQEQSHS